MNREHEVLNAFAEALREAQITGLAFIRVNANGHVQVLPPDRVRVSVIQAVEERTAAWVHDELQIGDAAEKSCDHPRRVIWGHGNQVCEACDICHTVRIQGAGPRCEHNYQSEFNGVGYDDICSKCGDTRPEECDHLWQQHLGEPEFRECIRCGRVEDVYE